MQPRALSVIKTVAPAEIRCFSAAGLSYHAEPTNVNKSAVTPLADEVAKTGAEPFGKKGNARLLSSIGSLRRECEA